MSAFRSNLPDSLASAGARARDPECDSGRLPPTTTTHTHTPISFPKNAFDSLETSWFSGREERKWLLVVCVCVPGVSGVDLGGFTVDTSPQRGTDTFYFFGSVSPNIAEGEFFCLFFFWHESSSSRITAVTKPVTAT